MVRESLLQIQDHQIRSLDRRDGLHQNIILVLHDWGSALGFDWAPRHPDAVKAIVYLEGIVRPFQSWDEWPEATRALFQNMRTSAGEDLILRNHARRGCDRNGCIST